MSSNKCTTFEVNGVNEISYKVKKNQLDDRRIINHKTSPYDVHSDIELSLSYQILVCLFVFCLLKHD